MTFSYAEFLQLIGLYFWPFVRIGAMISILPLFGISAVSPQTRIMLTLLITIVVAPTLTLPPPVDPFTWLGVLYLVQQILIGLVMGTVFLIVFQAFVMAGHIIAMGMGLAFAQMVDPGTGVTSTVVSQYFTIIVTLLFLAMNGHLVMIQAVVDSFDYLPIGTHFLNQESLRTIVEFGSYMFSAGVLVALPAITALLLINVAFGVVTRAAPALNIFAVGFPVTLLVGLVMLSLTTPLILPHLQELVTRSIDVLASLRLVGG
ncbi:flagellar biosynthetic protein FliR [Thiomicrorhabdus sp. ZW0627]|uniref:flagellar biosynthetic protein FliR n=1 Tax=Thiomicrorhabdus sp. ZW0627 TaxID=3039774 RepID=UPI0024367B75|nr:flagellar biosynthetic protein FliR [Thiomicrorhabdus sp. ZW0627]MDG6773331.1 flagellar biosynthetic protein FliR [Thiomicrorhabdus sp. ZW0627]